MCAEIIRCDWANRNPLMREYHDTEWGVPLHDERGLFAMLMLEGQQAGLSWATILARKQSFFAAFADFDPEVLALCGDGEVERLMGDEGIIRNRRKIAAVFDNARACLKICEKHGSLDRFFWSYVDYKPIVNAWTSFGSVPASTALSGRISADLKKFGFKFVGPTIVYAFMQSVGMVNDHLVSCAFYRRGHSV
ncbi:MAG: DNA-3-methyladenine glycosylase I [Desulfovibrio sp.]|nr:DNA-3-methyladenine glycosylase I [Desulfovibrio sp.]